MFVPSERAAAVESWAQGTQSQVMVSWWLK